jgi:hypothetical protein
MDLAFWKSVLWRQFGASLDMFGDAVRAFPPEGWVVGDPRRQPWYVSYHTLFWLDLYLSGAVEGFAPPPPFSLGELRPEVLPERPYTQAELLAYLDHGRAKTHAAIEGLSDERAAQVCHFGWGSLPYAELLLYNHRHVQHHTGQLNLRLVERTGAGPGWVCQAEAFRSP